MSIQSGYHDLERSIDQELALAESSRPHEPSLDSDAGWRENPEETLGYEARLRSLRGAVEAADA